MSLINSPPIDVPTGTKLHPWVAVQAALEGHRPGLHPLPARREHAQAQQHRLWDGRM